MSPPQVLQALCAAHVLFHPHVCALVPVGRVSVVGILRPCPAAVHLSVERQLASKQRSAHVGDQAL